MGKLTDDMSRLVNEFQAMSEDRGNFIKRVQEETRELLREGREENKQRAEENKQRADETRQFMKGVKEENKQRADETRQFLANVRNEMNSAHEVFYGRKTFRKE